MLRAMLLGAAVFFLVAGGCGPPPPDVIFLSDEALAQLEWLRKEANVHSDQDLIDWAMQLHRYQLRRQHGIRRDDCLADPVDGGTWHAIPCENGYGQRDTLCCRSS